MHNVEHMLTITWMLLWQSHVVNFSQLNTQNISGKPHKNSAWDLFNIWLAQSLPWEHMADLNSEYKSDHECCEAPNPLIPLHHPVSCDLHYWNGMWSTQIQTLPLHSDHYISNDKSLALCPQDLPAQFGCAPWCNISMQSLAHWIYLDISWTIPWTSHSPVLKIQLRAAVCPTDACIMI